MLRFIAAFCFFAPFFFSSPASAFQIDTSHAYAISGDVYLGDSAHPAAHILVKLRGSEGGDIDQQTTESGSFEFRQLKAGTYELDIQTSGFQPTSVPVDLNYAPSRGMEIVLRPIKGADSPVQSASVSSHELSIPQKARDLLAAGKIKLYERKDASGALADFQQALSIAPTYYEAEYQTGMANLNLGNREEAATHFQKSLDMSGGKYGDAYIGLGTLLLDKKDFVEGEKQVRHGIELAPDVWLGYYELGRALLYQDKLPDAQKAAEQARSLGSSAPPVYQLLANIHIKEKDYAAAQADIDAYIKLDPDSPAGQRAKQLREQLAQKIDSAKPAAPAPAASPQ